MRFWCKQFRLDIDEINEIKIRKCTNNLLYTNIKYIYQRTCPIYYRTVLEQTMENLQGRQMNRNLTIEIILIVHWAVTYFSVSKNLC